jgi:ABC-type branched-subunit amino acid transport system ATPase component
MSLLELTDLTVGRGGAAIASDLNLTVEEGEVVGLLGPNGAGKSSTLLTIAGGLRPLSGLVTFDGANMARVPAHLIAKRGIRFIPEGRAVVQSLTVAENLRLIRRPVYDATSIFPALSKLTARRAGLCSGGEQQMLALGMALAARARLLLIDELSLGLAPSIVAELLPVIRNAARERGIGVLLVEQQLEAALSVADRIVVLARGAIRISAPSDDLKGRLSVIEAAYLGSVQ